MDREGLSVELPLEFVAPVVEDLMDVQVSRVERDLGEAVVDRREAMGDGPGDRARLVIHSDLEADVLKEERPVPRRMFRRVRRREGLLPVRPTESSARFRKFAHRKPQAIQRAAERSMSIYACPEPRR